MTEQFFAALKARLVELTQDLRYLHKPTGGMIAPQIIDIMLDRPTSQTEEGEDYPYVRWLVYDGEFAHRTPAPFSVMLDGAIYTDGSIAAGNLAVSELCRALGRIVERPWFAPYKLRNRVRFVLGNPETNTNNHGLQPHPYYFCRLYLEFVVANNGHKGVEP